MKNKQSKKAKEIGKLMGEEEFYKKLRQSLIASTSEENKEVEEEEE